MTAPAQSAQPPPTARGEVRWLRPDYQRPRFGKSQTAGPAAGDLLGPILVAAGERAPWPKDRRAQVLALKGALAEAGALTPADLAARFKGRGGAEDVRRLVTVLQRDGQVRHAADGGYSLLRAA